MIAAAALVVASIGVLGASLERIDGGRLGQVGLFEPAGRPTGFVYLFSDSSGWTPDLQQAAESLRRTGAVVVGVDLSRYLRGLAASDDGCHYVISELELLSRRLQKEMGFDRYLSPILAGVGEGGTLAYAALAQSPAATIEGAVSVDPSPVLETRVGLCEGAPVRAAAGGGFSYGPQAHLPGWWRVSSTQPLPAELAALVTPTEKPTGRPSERLVAVLRPLLESRPTGAAESDLHDLPLTEIRVDHPGSLMAVIYSGDGGWRDIDKQIGGFLGEHGVPVVGVDALRYFWNTKTPEEVAGDLADVLRYYRARWRTPEVILVGYSFGAGVLPFAVNRLPAGDLASVVEVSLLGLESRADFTMHIDAWFGAGPSDEALPVLPEMKRMDLSRVQCFYGAEEDDTLCRSPALSGAEIIRTGGGHHFGGGYRALGQKILDGARRREPTR
jgi:type IV secretory pathway VirJ component